jgi:hypothetical protein
VILLNTNRWMRNAYTILVGKSEGNSPLRRFRCRWEDNIKIDFKRNRVGGCGIDSYGSGPLTGFSEHGNEPSGSIKSGEFLDWLSVQLASQEGLCSMELVISLKGKDKVTTSKQFINTAVQISKLNDRKREV